ncbi:hypothetical protein ABPG72_012191 [Tetrahymena utriculariae]
MEFDLKYYAQFVEFYPQNLSRTHTPKGYDYLIEPIKQQGICVVGLLLAATQKSYASFIRRTQFQRDKVIQYFAGDRKFYIAVDTEKDLLVGMTTYDTTFDNILNLPVNETGEISRVFVRKEYQGRGIASKIMKMVDEHAKKINRKGENSINEKKQFNDVALVNIDFLLIIILS